MQSDHKHKLMNEIPGQEYSYEQRHSVLKEDGGENVGTRGIVGNVEEQENIAEDGVDAQHTHEDGGVRPSKLMHPQPGEGAQPKQSIAAVEVLEGVHTGEVDGDEHVEDDAHHGQSARTHVQHVQLEAKQTHIAEEVVAEEVVRVVEHKHDHHNVED